MKMRTTDTKQMKHGFLQERLTRWARRNRLAIYCLTGGICAAGASVASAADKTWIGGDGLWSDAAHWDLGVPVAGDNAILSSPGTTSVYLSGPAGTLHDISVSAATPGATLLIGGGSLSANRAFIGNNSIGAVSQNAGTFTLTPGTPVTDGRLILGNTTGGVGTYSLSGGSVLADILTVGGGSTAGGTFGTGTFTQSGGTVNLNTGNVGELIVGDVPNSTGTYNLTGGTLQAKNVFVAVSGASAGERKIVQTGGVATIAGNLQIGGFTGGSAVTEGSYTLAGTSSTILNSANVYVGVSGIGTFTQDGGVNAIGGGVAGDRNLLVGATFAGSSGTYTLKSGVLSAEGEYIGNPGKGTFLHIGGTNNVNGQLLVDTGGSAASKGTYTISGGTLNTTGVGAQPGLLNVSEFNLNGGTVNVTGTGAENAGLDNRGAFTLAGGTLTGSGTKVNNGTLTGFGTISGSGALVNSGTINFTGGTTTVSTPVTNDSGKTLQISNSVAVFDGTIDNNGIIKTTAANVIFNGDYGGGGTIISDPSTQTFNTNFSMNPSGALVGGEGDIWRFGGNVTINSTNNTTDRTTTRSLSCAATLTPGRSSPASPAAPTSGRQPASLSFCAPRPTMPTTTLSAIRTTSGCPASSSAPSSN